MTWPVRRSGPSAFRARIEQGVKSGSPQARAGASPPALRLVEPALGVADPALRLVAPALSSVRRGEVLEAGAVGETVAECLLLLISALAEHDVATVDHSRRIRDLAATAGRHLRMPASALDDLSSAALLHDVGKLLVPAGILQKPGPLNDAEWRSMERHPELGADLLGGVDDLIRVEEIVRAHHERPDGRGYPHALEAGEVPLASCVIAVCDAYDAMTSDRPYQRPLAAEAALAELEAGIGTQFDARAVTALIETEGP